MTSPGPARIVTAISAGALVIGTLEAQTTRTSGLDPASFDASVRPQDDLYAYTNNRWLTSTRIADDRSGESVSSGLYDQIERRIHGIITRLAAQPNRRGAARQIVDLYTSIVDTEAVETRGDTALQPELRAIDAIASVRDLAERAGALTATTLAGPFFGSIATHPQNPAERIVRISQGGILLERIEYLGADPLSVEIRGEYRKYLTRIFTRVGRIEPEADADRVIDLETRIARVFRTPADAVEPPALLTVDRMNAVMPGFDWLAWAKPQGMRGSSPILIDQPSFFRGFAALPTEVPLPAWRPWLAARYITALAPNASEALGNERYEFFGRVLAGQQAPRPRWKRGVALVNAVLADAVGRMYVEDHFDRSIKSRVERIAGQVIQVWRQAVTSFDWPTPQSRHEAQGRMALLAARVGYPAIWRDYSSLVIKPDDLFGNMLRAQKFDNDRRMRQGGELAGAGEWPLGPQTPNAFYNPSGNEVILPAAVLQPPYFDAAADDAVNYGAIGAVIGHEAGHALDQSGRRLPEGYTIESFNDVTGLAVAFRAYERSLGGRPAPVIDGLTGPQRFFLGWARIWRELIRPEFARRLRIVSQHPPGAARVNAIVGHLEAFYPAFTVTAGDRLFIPAARRIRVF